MSTGWKFRKLCNGRRVLFPLVVLVLLVFAFSVSIRPVATTDPGVLSGGGFVFQQSVDSGFAKPGDQVNFTLSYVNNLGVTAYNVTVYEFMPSELAFVYSRPFYDGVSVPETGFYRWSRGSVLPNGNGTIVVRALVNKVPVGSVITNTAHLTFVFGNGTRAELTSSASVTVTQAAGVSVYPDQIHSVAPKTNAMTEYNVTVTNTGNALDTFDITLKSIAYNPSGSVHEWTIQLYNSTGYSNDSPVAVVYDSNAADKTSWTDHGVIAHVTLEMGQSTWFVIRVYEAEGTSGSGDAYLDVQLIANSTFDPSVSAMVNEMAIVRAVAGLTFAPSYSKEANPGDTVSFSHIIVNSGQSEVVDLSYASPNGWIYSLYYANGTPLVDTDGSGFVDVGVLPKNGFVYIMVKVTVPYNTPAGTVDNATITVRGVSTGNYDAVNDVTTVGSAPVLGISKGLVSENLGYKGDVVTYKIVIVNLGNTMLIRIPLDDTYETECLDFSSAQPVEDSYDELAGNIQWINLGALQPGQNVSVTVNFVATGGGQAIRESSNVIDAEDEFGNLISATCINTDLNLIGTYTLAVSASPVEAIGGSFNVTWIEHGSVKAAEFTTPQAITCDEGTYVTVSYPESPIINGDVRYVFAGYSPAAELLMDSDKTVILEYHTEYVLTFDQVGSNEPIFIAVDGTQLPAPLPQSFWTESGSLVTFSYPSIVTDSLGTARYVLTGVSGSETSSSVTVNAPTVVTGFYKTQYYLTVAVSPSDVPQAIPGEGWYDEGTVVALSTPSLVPVSDGVRYRFDQWVVGTSAFPSNLVSVSVDAPTTATAIFVKQFRLVVISDHDAPDPSVGEHWYDVGSSIAASVTSPADDNLAGTRYWCTGWLGTGSVPLSETGSSVDFVMTAPSSITWNWVVQYRLMVVSDHGAPNPVVGENWYDSGSSVTAFVSSPADEIGGTRYRCTGWTGSGSVALSGVDASASFSITMPSSITWNWITQYRVTVFSDHDTPDPVEGEHWYDSGTLVAASVTSPADETEGVRFVCAGFGGVGSVPSSGSAVSVSFVVTKPSVLTWNWIAQYELTVSSSRGSPSPSVGSYWYDEGTVIEASVVSSADESSGTRYMCLGWVGTGSVPEKGYSVSSVFIMAAPSSIQWIWQRQYYLTISTNPARLDGPRGEGWYDEGSYASISVSTPTGGDGIAMRYRFDNWAGTDVVQATQASTTIKVDSPKMAEAVFVKQFYLTMSTNMGEVTPKSGWYDVGSTVSIEAFAPTVVEGKGYVWHGWTGVGEGSFSGIDNLVKVVMNGAVAETGTWKIRPAVTIAISNETIANGDRIVVIGETSPVQSSVPVQVVYDSPDGSVIEHMVYTDVEGKFTDTLFLNESDFYRLFAHNGQWWITALRPGDISHETENASTTLKVKSQSMVQLPPILLAAVIVVAGLIAFVPPARKKKNGNGWRRVVLLLSVACLILGAVSLALSWVVVTGSVANDGVISRVNVQLYPFSQGAVSISDGISYMGPKVSSMVQMSSGPVLALYLIPVGCALALMGFYKPKDDRHRNLKTVVLVIAGVLFASSVIHTYLFVQSHASAIAGAGLGFGAGIYVSIVGSALTFVSALFATRENNEHGHEKPIQLKLEERPFFAQLYPMKSDDCVKFRRIMIRPKTEPSEQGWCNSHDSSCNSCASWHVYYRKILDSIGG